MYKNDIHDTEIKERLIWSKEKLDIDDFLGDSVSDIGNRIEHWDDPLIRVKHLDREDLESFWFKPMPPATSSGWYVFNMFKNEKNIHLSHAPVDNSIAIQVRIDGMLDKDIDHLTIKNKSELKRVLTQIGVI